MSRGHDQWPADRVALLKTRWTQGQSAGQIAKELGGVSRSAVIGKVHRLGLPGRAQPARSYNRVPKERIAAVKQPKPKAPVLAPEPWKEKGGRAGPNNVRFIDRTSDQCPMFLSGQDGAEGFVCGEPVSVGSWCGVCGKLIYIAPRAPLTVPKAA